MHIRLSFFFSKKPCIVGLAHPNYSYHKYLLKVYYILGTVSGTRDTVINKTEKYPVLPEGDNSVKYVIC